MDFIRDDVSEHSNVFDVLKERGFIEQCTQEEEIRSMLGREKIKFYIGFDPTADSLHVGHFMQIIIMMYMQKYGHTPIVLIGDGTAMVGDPSGRSDMRQMMTPETIQEYRNRFKHHFDRFIDFDDDFQYKGSREEDTVNKAKGPAPGKAACVNNASWLSSLKYIDFIRDIGRHFSVNSMLRAECFKQRLEKGLSFLEFNYMLMQSYDFMVMSRDLDCKMQFGGNDQWSNILFGVDLIRRELGKQAYGMTFALLTTSEGKKMGKTQKGALWLDRSKTSPYEFYQYWRNVEDADVNKCLRMLTFLPMKEVSELSSLKDREINRAKEILAFEVTKLVHGEEEAKKARDGAQAAFGAADKKTAEASENIPSTKMDPSGFEGEGMGVVDLIRQIGLVSSNSDGFRTIKQGGLTIAGEKVKDAKMNVTAEMFRDGKLLIRKGKKVFHIVRIS